MKCFKYFLGGRFYIQDYKTSLHWVMALLWKAVEESLWVNGNYKIQKFWLTRRIFKEVQCLEETTDIKWKHPVFSQQRNLFKLLMAEWTICLCQDTAGAGLSCDEGQVESRRQPSAGSAFTDEAVSCGPIMASRTGDQWQGLPMTLDLARGWTMSKVQPGNPIRGKGQGAGPRAGDKAQRMSERSVWKMS